MVEATEKSLTISWGPPGDYNTLIKYEKTLDNEMSGTFLNTSMAGRIDYFRRSIDPAPCD